mgnify:CR=1 FL=1
MILCYTKRVVNKKEWLPMFNKLPKYTNEESKQNIIKNKKKKSDTKKLDKIKDEKIKINERWLL